MKHVALSMHLISNFDIHCDKKSYLFTKHSIINDYIIFSVRA